MSTIKEIRLQLGLSQAQFAEKLAVSQQTVSGWEKGAKTPRADKLIRIARLGSCTVDDLLKES